MNEKEKEKYIFINEDLKNFIASLVITKKPKIVQMSTIKWMDKVCTTEKA